MKNQYIASVYLRDDTEIDTSIYPFNLPFIQDFEEIEFHPQVTFILGENGVGKSTLIEAIAVAYWLNAEGGSKNFNFATNETHSLLSEHIRVAKGIQLPIDKFFLRAESTYNLATNIDELDKEPGAWPLIKDSFWGKSLHEQSHGESFFSIFMHRFMGEGMYILDEPEAALSPQRQIAFLSRLDDLVKQKSQFIIATHSPIILSYPHAKIIEIGIDGTFSEKEYAQTHHYATYKSFLDNPQKTLKHLWIL